MRTNKAIFGLFTIVGILVIILLLRKTTPRPSLPSSHSSPTAQVSQQPQPTSPAKPSQELIEALARTPVVFFGRVLDETGEPVKGAEVKVSAMNLRSQSDHPATTDQDGRFSVGGFEAAGLKVFVVPPKGYRRTTESKREVQIADLSGIDFGLSEAAKSKIPRPYKPDEKNPMLFYLEKIGPAESLYYSTESINLPPDGSQVIMSFDHARHKPVHPDDQPPADYPGHAIELSMTVNKEPAPPEQFGSQFTWSFQIRVPGGGLAPMEIPKDPHGRKWVGEAPPDDRGKDPDFFAPEGGYQETVKFNFDKAMAKEDWDSSQSGEYFVKFNDGTFGRLQFRALADGIFASVTGYYNPSGGRNTRFDNSKVIPLIK